MNEYKRRWFAGEVAPPGSRWQRDNQYSYSMYLTNSHNVDLHSQRVEEKGVLTARFEPAEELQDLDIEINKPIYDGVDESDYPCSLNFLPSDIFREVMEQELPTDDEISVTFPLQPDVQQIEQLVRVDTFKLFKATPPLSLVQPNQLTFVQRKTLQLGTDMKHKILSIVGKVTLN